MKDPNDRMVHFEFAGEDEFGNEKRRQLIAQLTGRSANLFLVNENQKIISAARSTKIAGQQIGDKYGSPAAQSSRQTSDRKLLQLIEGGEFASASEAADAYFTSLVADRDATARLAAARTELRMKIAQQEKLLKQLEQDQKQHSNFQDEKRIGDLLLANLGTAKRTGSRVTLIDYFADDASLVEIEMTGTQMMLKPKSQDRFAGLIVDILQGLEELFAFGRAARFLQKRGRTA